MRYEQVQLLSTFTTAGDIVQATGAGAVAKLGIGAAGGILQVNAGATALAYLALGTARQVQTVNAGATALAYQNPITLATEQASTSGTSINFTGIPAGVKRITVMFKGVSTNGVSGLIVQLGNAGGIEATGYIGASSAQGMSTGFDITGGSVAAAGVYSGLVLLALENASAFTWVMSSNIARSDVVVIFGSAGYKSLSAELTQVRITMANGTDTFDAGAISISYE